MRNLAMVLLAAISIVGDGTESKWTVTKGPTTLGTITLLTSENATRAEWKASGFSWYDWSCRSNPIA